jgi:hypothetical protein
MTAGLGAVILGGRELYRVGYQTNDGPNSKIREAGAIPLNIAELLIALGLCFTFMRYRFGLFISNRNIVQKFTMTKYQKTLHDMRNDVIKGKNKKSKKIESQG